MKNTFVFLIILRLTEPVNSLICSKADRYPLKIIKDHSSPLRSEPADRLRKAATWSASAVFSQNWDKIKMKNLCNNRKRRDWI